MSLSVDNNSTFPEHDEHAHLTGVCLDCGREFCRNCSNATNPKTFCSSQCEGAERMVA